MNRGIHDEPDPDVLLLALERAWEDGPVINLERFDAARALLPNYWYIHDFVDTLEELAPRLRIDDRHRPALRAHAAAAGFSGRELAAALLFAGWPDHQDTFALFLAIAQEEDYPDVQLGAIVILARRWAQDAGSLECLLTAAEAKDRDVRAVAVKLLIKVWPDHPAVRTCRQAWITDAAREVRKAAISAIARENDDAIVDTLALAERLVQDEDDDVRSAAALVLCRRLLNAAPPTAVSGSVPLLDAFAFAGLRELVESDAKPELRKAALACLAACWPGEPGAWSTARAAAMGDPTDPCAADAVRVIEWAWPRHARALDLMLTLLRRPHLADQEGDVRWRAAHAIASCWGGDAQVLAALSPLLDADDKSIRHAAMESVRIGWPGDPQARRLLFGLLDDPDVMTRGRALRNLSKHWADPEVVDLAYRAATEDEHWAGRWQAVINIAHHFPEDLRTTAVLQDRALHDPDERVRSRARGEIERLDAESG